MADRIVRSLPRNMTKEQAREFIRKVSGPSKRELEGKEYNDIWLLLQLTTPISESNNQRSLTYAYELAGNTYYVTYGIEDTPIIEQVDENEDSF